MAQPPVFRRFTIADFPQAPAWLSIFFSSLNIVLDQIVALFSRNLTVGDNVRGSWFTASFTTPAGYATGDFLPISYSYTGGGIPSCLTIASISDATGTTILTPVSVAAGWRIDKNSSPYRIIVDYIAGLQPSTRYTVTLMAIGI